MFEITIIVIVLAMLAAGSYNPFVFSRKLLAWFGFGVGATPTAFKYAKEITTELREEAKFQLEQEGVLHEKTYKVFKDKGDREAQRVINPLIQESQARQARLKELAEKARAKAAK